MKTVNLELIEARDTAQSLFSDYILKNKSLKQHSRRVALLCQHMSLCLGLSKEEDEFLYEAALLHDIGKAFIPLEIINKPGKLTMEEWEIVKKHPQQGFEILSSFENMHKVAFLA